MIKEPSLQNTQTPENQPPPPVESFDVGKEENKVAGILNRLAEIQDLIEEDDESNIDKYKPELEKFLSDENSYFIRRKIGQIMKPPLDDLDMESKRIFLKNNWDDMCHEMSKCTVIDRNSGKPFDLKRVEGANPLSLDDISDSDVERFFGLYRKLVPYKYSVYERNRYEHGYNDSDIIENYKVPETNLTSASSFYFSRLNDDYCALYNFDQNGVTQFYKLDKETEKNIKEKKTEVGGLSIRNLENIIIDLEEAVQEKNTEFIKEYIYFRRGLPQSARDELDKNLKLDIPSELDREFVDNDEFKILLHKHSKEVSISTDEEDVNFLQSSLKDLLSRKYQTCAERNNGFKTDNLFLLKNVAKGYFNVLEGRYYWFEDYLREKRFLPEDLVDEFEKRIPMDFKKYETEEFPYYDNSFFEDIEKKKPKIKEHFNWLGKEIMKRFEEINQKRPELKEVGLEEILKSEGTAQKEISNPENEAVLANYKALMELQTRKSIEDEFGIKLNEFSFREQVQFVNFLSTKTDKEVEDVKKFLIQGNDGLLRKNRVKSFLSLESGQLSGEQIINIGNELKDDPELANRLFFEYANLVDSANQKTDEMTEIYNSIFFEKQVDKDKILKRIMNRGAGLLIESGQNLSGSQDKEKIIEELIRNLKTEEIVQKKMLSDFQDMYKELEKIEKRLFEYDFDEILNVFFYNHLNEFQETLDGDDKENFSNDFHISVSSKSIKEGERMWMTYERLWRRYANKKSKELLKSQMIEIYRYLSEGHGSKRDKSKGNDDIISEFEDWNKKQAGILSLEKNLDEYLQKNIYGDEVSDENLSDDLVKEFLSGNVADSSSLNKDEIVELKDIENQLKNHPGVADKIFAQYAEMVDTINELGRRVYVLYDEVFGESELDKEQIVQISLNRASKMLLDLSKELNGVDDNKKEELANKLIHDMQRQEKIRIRQLSDLAGISRNFQKSKQDLLNELFIQGGEYKVMCEIFGDPEKYNSPDELNKAIESGEITPWWMDAGLNVDKFFEKIDSKILEKIILASKKSIRSLKKMLRDEGYNKMMDDEQIKKFGEPDPVDVRKFERYNSEIKSGKNKIKKAEEVLQFQMNFERRFNDLVYGNKKRDLSENLEPTISDRLFQKYQEIIDQTKTTKDQIKSLFKNEKDISDEELDNVTEIILKKANHLLLSYSKRIGEGEDIDEQELVNELEGYKADLVLTASVWKSVDKSDLSFEDLEGVNFEVETIGRITSEGRVMSIVDEISQKETDEKHPFIPGANIRGVVSKYAHEASSEERQRAQEILEMIDIYRKNYVHKPKLQKKIVEGFVDKLRTASDDTLVYSFKKDGQVLAFNRFDQMEGNRKYFGSFNVDPSLSGSAVGTALMRVSLDREAENNDIEADCDPETMISSYYIEKAGFVVNGVMPNYGDTGETVFGIERKKENKQYAFRNMSHEELVAEHEKRFRGNVYRKDLPRMVLKFEKDSNELFESSERLVNSEGYVMTRYFFDKGGKHAYCAFERGGN